MTCDFELVSMMMDGKVVMTRILQFRIAIRAPRGIESCEVDSILPTAHRHKVIHLQLNSLSL
jgi:hypothetical protein